MALRVLLADESTTIKKVMQLALQDFAVEVKAVHAGVDVLDVARSFQPDVIFADVLLQKKNGYEVCGLLKADAGLKAVPVVLMWSSFMDLDDQLAKNAGAEGRLEKPFDVETLRKLVLELVPKTRTQRLAHFLDFPQKPTEELRLEETEKSTAAANKASPVPPGPAAPAYREPIPVPKRT
ncbi:MAG: response regulator, partial [Proteobacteria bacterium]